MTFTQNTSLGVSATLNRCNFPRSFASDSFFESYCNSRHEVGQAGNLLKWMDDCWTDEL
jgi:hypothetical protein